MVPLRVRAAVYSVRLCGHAPLVQAALRDVVPPCQDHPMVRLVCVWHAHLVWQFTLVKKHINGNLGNTAPTEIVKSPTTLRDSRSLSSHFSSDVFHNTICFADVPLFCRCSFCFSFCFVCVSFCHVVPVPVVRYRGKH